MLAKPIFHNVKGLKLYIKNQLFERKQQKKKKKGSAPND